MRNQDNEWFCDKCNKKINCLCLHSINGVSSDLCQTCLNELKSILETYGFYMQNENKKVKGNGLNGPNK